MSKASEQERKNVYSALFAFAQNFGFEWHATFIKWLVDDLLDKFTDAEVAAGIRRVMLREERPWSPFGSLHKECLDVCREIERERDATFRIVEEQEQRKAEAARRAEAAKPENAEKRRQQMEELKQKFAVKHRKAIEP